MIFDEFKQCLPKSLFEKGAVNYAEDTYIAYRSALS